MLAWKASRTTALIVPAGDESYCFGGPRAVLAGRQPAGHWWPELAAALLNTKPAPRPDPLAGLYDRAMGAVWVWADVDRRTGVLLADSMAAIGEARRITGSRQLVTVVTERMPAAVEIPFISGADSVVSFDDRSLSPVDYGRALSVLWLRGTPQIMLFPASLVGQTTAGALAETIDHRCLTTWITGRGGVKL